MAHALDGLRVVECGGRIAAAYCGKLFADLGAEVVKVEIPAGDPCRAYPPLLAGAGGERVSALFLYLNGSKRSITLDLEAPEGQEQLRDLARDADLLVHNFAPRIADGYRLSYESFADVNARLVVTSITGFGRSGPYRDYAWSDLTTAASGGWTFLSPGSLEDPALPPLKAFGSQTEFIAGDAAAVASMGAIFAAEQTGLGEDVDVSAQACIANCLEGALGQYLYEGAIATRMGVWLSSWLVPFPCKNGAVLITAAHHEQWLRLVEAMGSPEWASWEVFSTAERRVENFDVLRSLVLEWMKEIELDTLLGILSRHRVPAATYQDVPQVLKMPQLAGRDFFRWYTDPALGSFVVPGAPYKFSVTPCIPPGAPLRRDEVPVGIRP